MLTGEIRSQIDAIWNAFWTGGISNPLEVIEQITYLLFLKRLDDLHTLEENKAARLKTPIERRIFPEGADPKGRSYEDLRPVMVPLPSEGVGAWRLFISRNAWGPFAGDNINRDWKAAMQRAGEARI